MNAMLADLLIVLAVLVPAPKGYAEERGHIDQTAEEFQKTFNELHPQGWRLKRIKGYEKDGVSRFDSVWHKPAEARKFFCRHGVTRDHYESETARLKDQGYAEVLKCTWKVKGEERVWAVWEMK